MDPFAQDVSFMAPELADETHRYNEKVDVWSVGIILYILLFGKLPFNGDSAEEIT